MNNNKLFIENSILTAVFLIILYFSATFIYSLFKDGNVKVPSLDFNITVPEIDTNILLNNYIDKNTTNLISANKLISKEENQSNVILKAINKKDLNLTNDTNTSNKTKEIITSKKEIVKELSPKKETIKKIKVIKKDTVKKTQNVSSKKTMLNHLSLYIKNTIIAVRNNAYLSKGNKETDLSIKIRITVLDDGTYQNIKHLSGNKALLADAKRAIKKTFPRIQDKKIRSQFPRYIRFNIEFKNEQ